MCTLCSPFGCLRRIKLICKSIWIDHYRDLADLTYMYWSCASVIEVLPHVVALDKVDYMITWTEFISAITEHPGGLL